MRKNKNNRNEFTLKILETIGHLSLGSVDFLDRLASGGKYLPKNEYRELMKRKNKRHSDWDAEIEEMRDKQKFYSTLYNLHKSGLIEKKKVKNKTLWSITKKGKDRKDELFFKLRTVIFAPKEKYKLEPNDHPIIVVFDIPEKERNKREWLRAVLQYLGFELLQKSVWIGSIKLPEELITDLEKLNMLSSVKIFSVLENGNI